LLIAQERRGGHGNQLDDKGACLELNLWCLVEVIEDREATIITPAN